MRVASDPPATEWNEPRRPGPHPPLILRSRGLFAVLDPDLGDVAPRSRKARALLAYLAVHPGEAISRERLAALLWSDRGEEQARASLRQCLYELRAIARINEALRVDASKVALAEGAVRWDLDELRAAVQGGRLEALAQWLRHRGMLEGLDGLDAEFDDWLRGERDRRARELRGLVATEAEAALARGDVAAARDLCTGFADQEPADEVVAMIGLRADAAAGDVAALRRRYHALEAALRSELDASPSPETTALFRRLLGGVAAARPVDRAELPVGEGGAAMQPPASARSPAPDRTRWRRVGLVVATLALLVAIGAVWSLWPRGAPPLARRPTVVAVLPFEPLTPGDAYLAEGLWEDTRGELSRNPALRVIGRTTAKAYAGRRLAPQAYRDKLGAAFLLDGSVRRAGERVRVNVNLVRTADGVGVWDASFDARLGDALALQQAIARGIEGRLRARLAPGGGTRAEQISTSPEVYALFSEARALTRLRERAAALRAITLLRRAVALDPNFAPAWAALGVALRLNGGGPAGNAAEHDEALASIRRALALAPNLAQAHAARALIEGEGSPAAGGWLARAVALDPGNAEAWMWLGNNRAMRFRRDEARRAYWRSVEIDPLWPTAVSNLAMLLADLGDSRGIDRLAARVGRAGAPRELLLSIGFEAARARGDHSAAVAPLLAFRRANAGRPRGAVDWQLGEGLTALGYVDEAARLLSLPGWFVPVVRGEAPPPAAIDGQRVEARDFWLDLFVANFGSRALLNLGRRDELLARYREGFRTPEDAVAALRRTGALVSLAPTLAPALRGSDRPADADYLLAAAERQVETSLARAPGHRALSWALGRIRVAQGREGEGLRLIERAAAAGWLPDGAIDALDIAHDPSLRPLAGTPRFEAVRRRILAHIERERAELGPVRI